MRVKIKNHSAGKYIPYQPPMSDIIGKITRPGAGGTGALVLLDTWEFVQYNDGVQLDLEQRPVYTAIIKAILSDFCEVQVDLAIAAGFSLDTIKSWSSGRRVPAFGTVKLLLLTYNIIQR